MKHRSYENGIALITTLFLLALLSAMLGAYAAVTRKELASTRLTADSVSGFYAAEGGLNIRAEDIKAIFVGYNRPTGTTPSSSTPCEGSDLGAGDFACQDYSLSGRAVTTYVVEDPSNPIITTIPPGERYQGLNAQEYRYTVSSIARGVNDKVEAMLQLRFKSRLVPLFQFVAFYDKDLEILPGPTMNLSGPIHTNGDLYLNANNALNIAGQITTAGDLYRGRKNDASCNSKPVTALDPLSPLAILPSCSSRTLVNEFTAWNGMVESNVLAVTVPEPEILDPSQSSVYYDKADLRLALHLDAANNPDTSLSVDGIEVRNADGSVNSVMTSQLHNATNCPGSLSGLSIGSTASFYNNREGITIQMLEVDLQALFNCLHQTNWLGEGTALNDNTEGGLVFHLSVDGPNSTTLPNSYGVRLRNANELQSSTGGAPLVRGLTVVSDQAAYTYGNYNASNKIPAAILADSFNVLSANWNDANSMNWSARGAVDTTINAAILAGTDTTGGVEGSGGQGGAYNGGLENYPRFHENWSGRTLIYRGSFVSLNSPRYVDGAWHYGSPQYTAPGRNWDYDTDFNDASNLPPLTPRFVYLRQELFVRDFEQ